MATKDLEKKRLFVKYWEIPFRSGILRRTLFIPLSKAQEEEVE
jgi:hypothetical protein